MQEVLTVIYAPLPNISYVILTMTLRGGYFWDPGSQLRKFRPGKVAVLRSQNRTGPGRVETSDPHNPHLRHPHPRTTI